MKLVDLFNDSRKGKVLLKALNRKKNNPKQSKTTKYNTFIDVFGGMVNYPSTSQVNPDSSTVQS